MPAGRRESYEAVPRRPEQQGTEGPALSMSPVFSVPLLPCLKQTLSCLSPLLLIEPVHLLPCLSHTLSPYPPYPAPASALCYSQNLFICYPVFLIPYSCLKHTLSLHQPSVTPRTCSSVTLSFSYLVPYPPYPVPLSTLPCPYPVTKKVKPYSFTFFFFPLLSLLIRSRAVTTKTYFVCPP